MNKHLLSDNISLSNEGAASSERLPTGGSSAKFKRRATLLANQNLNVASNVLESAAEE